MSAVMEEGIMSERLSLKKKVLLMTFLLFIFPISVRIRKTTDMRKSREERMIQFLLVLVASLTFTAGV